MTVHGDRKRSGLERTCHVLAALLVCIGLIYAASGFIADYLHPERISSFPSYTYLFLAVPFIIVASVIEIIFLILERRGK